MNIREWRESLGLNQSQMAAMIAGEAGISVNRQNLRQWENGSLPNALVGEAIRKLSKGQVKWLPRNESNNNNKKLQAIEPSPINGG